MIEQDTIRLLRECDAGIKMGVSSIQEVIGYVSHDKLRKCLEDCKAKHEKLQGEIQAPLRSITMMGRNQMSWQRVCRG